MIWDNIKSWFKHSETILLARLEAVVGFVMAVISAVDWSPIMSLGYDSMMSVRQGMIIGGIMFVKGTATEWVRRRNTIEVNNRLIPTSILKEVKTEITTNLPDEVTTTTSEVKT